MRFAYLLYFAAFPCLLFIIYVSEDLAVEKTGLSECKLNKQMNKTTNEPERKNEQTESFSFF